MPDRDALVRAHEDIYASLTSLVEELGPDDWHRPTGCAGWDVKDQVAHVVSLEGLLAGDPYPAEHAVPDDLPHVRDDFGRFVEVLVDVRRSRSVDELVAELHDVLGRRRAQLATVDDLAEEAPSLTGEPQPLYRSLPIRVIDLYLHEQDVRRAVDRPGHIEGPAPELVVDRMAKGLEALLPQRVDAAGTVVFEVAGGASRTVRIDLGGGGDAVRIPVTVPQFVALAGGRDDAPRVGDLDVQGDRELAGRVLAACGMTP